MNFGGKTMAFSINLLPLILSLVHMAEVLHGSGNGAEKKAAVIEGVKQAAAVGITAVQANNPKHAAQIDMAINIASATLFPKGTSIPDAADQPHS